MTDTDGTEYRQHYRATGSDMTVREDVESQEGDDGIIEIRMPIASTGEVRNANDDPLTRDELDGMARQLSERDIGVFPAHGMSDMIASSKYSPFERLGDWHDAALETRDGEELLMATARMPDPETLPAATGKFREALAILKEQAMRGISQDASIGWRDDDSFPGGVDLMEASIVGIGADWRTNTADEQAEAVARAAVEAGADPQDLVAAVERAVEPDAGRPLGPPGDRDRFEDFDACVAELSDSDDTSEADAKAICGAWEQESKDQSARVESERAEYEVGDETIEISPPEYMQANARRAMEAERDTDIAGDCGTGVGDERARQIQEDNVGPEVVDEVAAYLTSHAEDVTASGSTGEWTDEEWADCGNRQYAKWGGDGSGDALAWAQEHANRVAEAKGEDIPYDRNLDDPEFSEGDAVSWPFQGDTVHGRVADIGDEFTVSGNTITGDEGEAVYLIHEWDESVEAFREENVAKPQSSLSESQMDMPPATDENFQAMSDTDDPGDEQAGTDDEQTGGDAETTERAPGDVTENDLLTFTARHYDGTDESDLAEAVDATDGEYIGECNPEALFDFVSIVTDAEYGTVKDAMADLMEDADSELENKDDEEMEGDDEDEEMNTADSDDADAEQSADADADADGDDDADNLLRDIESQLDEVDDAREALRNGDVDISYAAGDGEVETDSEQDTDDDLAGLDLRESNLPN